MHHFSYEYFVPRSNDFLRRLIQEATTEALNAVLNGDFEAADIASRRSANILKEFRSRIGSASIRLAE